MTVQGYWICAIIPVNRSHNREADFETGFPAVLRLYLRFAIPKTVARVQYLQPLFIGNYFKIPTMAGELV